MALVSPDPTESLLAALSRRLGPDGLVHLERLRRKNKRKQWKRQRVRERELARLTGKIVSTRKAEDDDYYFETERRLRAWAKRVRRRPVSSALLRSAR